MGFLEVLGVMLKQYFVMQHVQSTREKLRVLLISESCEIQIFVRLYWR